ncbi:MAG TPA: hypothetical protein P5567_00050 [Kiritimatiellia bacterium]|nr:hypothetical protein [Kiritimatiellia bacterium]HRZ10828.1 hypothetical protein [Kiritimatiellia bacterium]HSA18899.1 hypothetical protein [Kiritimatiellia bacterium]
MENLPWLARWSLYGLMSLMGVLGLMIGAFQFRTMRGGVFHNCDGSKDDWHEQPTHYGIALADVCVACPVSTLGVILAFAGSRWGFYLLALASFWWLWANVMTTATSLKFHQPKITLMWFFTFPLGALLGLAYLVLTFVHFDALYRP